MFMWIYYLKKSVAFRCCNLKVVKVTGVFGGVFTSKCEQQSWGFPQHTGMRGFWPVRIEATATMIETFMYFMYFIITLHCDKLNLCNFGTFRHIYPSLKRNKTICHIFSIFENIFSVRETLFIHEVKYKRAWIICSSNWRLRWGIRCRKMWAFLCNQQTRKSGCDFNRKCTWLLLQ